MPGISSKIKRWKRSIEGKYLRPGYEPKCPENINIETSEVCNLRCECCPHGASGVKMRCAGMMTVDTFRRVVANIDIPVRRAFLHLHGEPFLNPDLPDFVGELVRRQVTVNLYSNCTIVDEAKLDAVLDTKRVTINFSADLLGKEYYERIRRGAQYEETLDKLDRLNEVFARHNLFFNIVVIMEKEFVGQEDEVAECCELLYNRYTQLNGILLGSKFPWPRLPWTGDLDGQLARGTGRCSYAFEGLSILWNGDATMCSFDYTGECVVGSLLENSYSEILNSQAARQFRMMHWRHKGWELPMCSDCLLDRYLPRSVILHRREYLNQERDEKRKQIERFWL